MVRRNAREKWLTDRRHSRGYVLERDTTVEVGAENFLGSSLLPRRKPATNGPHYRSQPAVGLKEKIPAASVT